jgi:hypothetical protein
MIDWLSAEMIKRVLWVKALPHFIIATPHIVFRNANDIQYCRTFHRYLRFTPTTLRQRKGHSFAESEHAVPRVMDSQTQPNIKPEGDVRRLLLYSESRIWRCHLSPPSIALTPYPSGILVMALLFRWFVFSHLLAEILCQSCGYSIGMVGI